MRMSLSHHEKRLISLITIHILDTLECKRWLKDISGKRLMTKNVMFAEKISIVCSFGAKV